MILSEKQMMTLSKIDSLKKQIDLLDSHKTVGLITDKQYKQSLAYIVRQIEEMEEEWDITAPYFIAENVMYGDYTAEFNDFIDQVIEKGLFT